MNGWDCLKKLKSDSNLKTIPVIMYSTSSAKRDIDMAHDLGAVAFLSKPEKFDELSQILRTVATASEDILLTLLKAFRSIN